MKATWRAWRTMIQRSLSKLTPPKKHKHTNIAENGTMRPNQLRTVTKRFHDHNHNRDQNKIIGVSISISAIQLRFWYGHGYRSTSRCWTITIGHSTTVVLKTHLHLHYHHNYHQFLIYAPLLYILYKFTNYHNSHISINNFHIH